MIIRGREFSKAELQLIQETVLNQSSLSRRKLSIVICQLLDWRQPNGRLKDRACRDVLLRLHNEELIRLPDPYYQLETQAIAIRSFSFSPPTEILTGIADDFKSLRFEMVSTLPQRHLWNYLIDRYHYLGCRIAVGRHLKYFVYLDQHLIGCLGFADAVLKLNLRDHWIGWNIEQREANLRLVINNVRLLLLPWVKVKNLASKILGQSAKTVPDDWQRFYQVRPVLMETFVETQRFTGTSYKAANWTYLGSTRGKGRRGMNYYRHGVIKDVYVYPLVKKSWLRKILTARTSPS